MRILRYSTLAVTLASLPLMAQQKKADAPKPAVTKSSDIKELDPAEMYALQKASEDVQAAQQVFQQKQQVLAAIGNSIQRRDGCRIQQQAGKLVCIVELAPSKK